MAKSDETVKSFKVVLLFSFLVEGTRNGITYEVPK